MAKTKKKTKKSVSKSNMFKAHNQIEPKALSQARSDVKIWKNAEALATHPESPKMFPLHNLYKDILKDGLLSSQIENRNNKTLGSGFSIKKANGDTDEDVTKSLKQSILFGKVMGYILDVKYHGFTVLEFDYDKDGKAIVKLIPRQNILPKQKLFLKDSSDDKGVVYTDLKEYGTWILDFGDDDDLGIINKAVPHALFKRFAASCWSELCEIMGIPPRVMKTDTANKSALNRAENMMKDWGAAAWFIIDHDEKIEWAQSTQSKGEVYEGLKNFCNNEMSLLISGAIIGQDTKHGNKGKEESSQEVLQDLVTADKNNLQKNINEKVLPALKAIGVIPYEDFTFEFDLVEDLGELWSRTKDVINSPSKDVPNEWIETKFGIPVIDKVQPAEKQLGHYPGFFD